MLQMKGLFTLQMEAGDLCDTVVITCTSVHAGRSEEDVQERPLKEPIIWNSGLSQIKKKSHFLGGKCNVEVPKCYRSNTILKAKRSRTINTRTKATAGKKAKMVKPKQRKDGLNLKVARSYKPQMAN